MVSFKKKFQGELEAYSQPVTLLLAALPYKKAKGNILIKEVCAADFSFAQLAKGKKSRP